MDPRDGSLVPEPFGPLDGVRILSTGTLIAQPFAAHLAGAFGAEVIQIEHPSGTCDPWRTIDFPVPGRSGRAVSSSFVQERRNAFYITLDLSTPEGRELFLRLVRSRDIWMESSKPGTYAKWGLSDDAVLAANPALVITHVSGYGQSGHPDYLGRASYAIRPQDLRGSRDCLVAV
jgi:crotonobetainyl-CoA:carnitine CoA-transferase CaiB-like acyl-CoA transferase